MKRWYVVQVYTGYEDLVRADLEKRIVEEGMQDLFGQVMVPASNVAESLFHDATTRKEKIFPGYLLVQMEMTGDAHRLVLSAPRVSRFLGGASPMPLSDREYERIAAQISGEIALSKEKEQFTIGNEVHVTEGPFSGFDGIIEKVDEEHERLTIMVSIFGRMTPVELGFDQVKR